MEITTLQAEVREGRGKGSARRLRRQGQIPAVFYGPGLESTPLALYPKEIEKALRTERGRNMVFSIKWDGRDELAMVKDLATDPLTNAVLHVDLYRIFADRELEVMVPFRTLGRAIGVVQGGVLNVTRRQLPIRTMPDKIPSRIEVDVSALDMHDSISVKDLPFAEGVTCLLKPELTLVVVSEDRKAAALAAEEEAAAAAAAAGAVAPAGAAAPGETPAVAPAEEDGEKPSS